MSSQAGEIMDRVRDGRQLMANPDSADGPQPQALLLLEYEVRRRRLEAQIHEVICHMARPIIVIPVADDDEIARMEGEGGVPC